LTVKVLKNAANPYPFLSAEHLPIVILTRCDPAQWKPLKRVNNLRA